MPIPRLRRGNEVVLVANDNFKKSKQGTPEALVLILQHLILMTSNEIPIKLGTDWSTFTHTHANIYATGH